MHDQSPGRRNAAGAGKLAQRRDGRKKITDEDERSQCACQRRMKEITLLSLSWKSIHEKPSDRECRWREQWPAGEMVEVADKIAQGGHDEHRYPIPVSGSSQGSGKVPFAPLAEFAAHEDQLLPDGPVASHKRKRVSWSEALPGVTGMRSGSRGFCAIDDPSSGKVGSTKFSAVANEQKRVMLL